MPPPIARTYVVDGNLKALGYEQVTGLTAAKTLTIPTGARVVALQAQDQDIRWRDDGTDPTATVGMILIAGDRPFLYNGNDLTALSFFEAAATAILNVTYYS